MADRGQSETLGFVLVFAIITVSIGLVFASGFTGLNDAREFEQVNNAERAFEVFADNMEDITHRNAPSRSTEVKLADAQLRIAEHDDIEINHPDGGFNATYSLRPVIYDADTGTELVYVQGAVIRSQGDGGRVITEDTFVIGETRTIIPVIETRLRGEGQVSGSATVLIRADHSRTQLVYANESPAGPVWFNITSPRAAIWADHLSATHPHAECDLDEATDTVSCSVESDRVYVTLIQIDLAIE